jgi:cytochrome c556
MRRPLLCWMTGFCLTAIVGMSLPAKEPPAATPQQKLMEAKLAHAQSLLSSLARQDFDKMSQSADKLLELAKQQWRDKETPEYRAHLKNFWTVLEGVKSAAEAKDLDKATTAYSQMTISCVNCHKYLRDQSN